MTEHYNGGQINRLDRIEAILERVAEQQANTQQQLDSFIQSAETVLARSAVLDDVVLALHDNTETLSGSFEQHQQNFEQHLRIFEQHQRTVVENQRTTNAALERLEAILVQLIRRLDG